MPLGIAQHGGQTVCPKSRTVFASLPTFLFMPAVIDSKSQLKVSRADVNAIFRIQHAEVLADDFWRRVAVQPLRAGIPTANQSFRRERVDREILDRRDQQPEL